MEFEDEVMMMMKCSSYSVDSSGLKLFIRLIGERKEGKLSLEIERPNEKITDGQQKRGIIVGLYSFAFLDHIPSLLINNLITN